MEGLETLLPPVSDGVKVIASAIGTALAAFIIAWRGYKKGQPTVAATSAAAAAIEAAAPIPMACRAGELQGRFLETDARLARIEDALTRAARKIEEDLDHATERHNERITGMRDILVEIRTHTRPRD